ncbi:hypothetical protein R80B4_03118 [Fibrobacteres bacterium R8-0-B4]
MNRFSIRMFGRALALAAAVIAAAGTGAGAQTWNVGCALNSDGSENCNINTDFGEVWGTNVTATLSGGTLTISGTGKMANGFDDQPSSGVWLIGLGYQLGEGRIENFDAVVSAVVEDGVESIGNFAFFGFKKLTSVSIGGSVKSIGTGAFSGCSSLVSITLPASVETLPGGRGCYRYSMYGGGQNCVEGVFGGSSVDSVTVLRETPPTVASGLDENRFPIARLGLPATVPVYVPAASVAAYKAADGWKYCEIDAIGGATLREWDCGKPTAGDVKARFDEATGTLTISGTGEMVTYADNLGEPAESPVPWKAIVGSIKSFVVESGVTTVGYYACYKCTSLTSVTLPAGLTVVGGDAFNGCAKLTTVSIPGKVGDIWYRAFANCTGLTTVNMYGATKIYGQYGGPFSGCTNLKTLNVYINVPPVAEGYATGSSFDGLDVATTVVNVPIGKEEAYKAAVGWKGFLLINGNLEVTSVASSSREVPKSGTVGVSSIAPVKSVSGALSAGPNPVKAGGVVSLRWSGSKPVRGTLAVFDAVGGLAGSVDVSGAGKVGEWRTDGVSAGTYLIKGVLTDRDGARVGVSVVVGVR